MPAHSAPPPPPNPSPRPQLVDACSGPALTPLHAACEGGHADLAARLLQSGADPERAAAVRVDEEAGEVARCVACTSLAPPWRLLGTLALCGWAGRLARVPVWRNGLVLNKVKLSGKRFGLDQPFPELRKRLRNAMDAAGLID